MLNWLKIKLGLQKPEQKIPTEFEVGVVKNMLVIRFNQPVLQLELDRSQTLNLIEILTQKVTYTAKVNVQKKV